jgi:mRNA interferase RelE/StbE
VKYRTIFDPKARVEIRRLPRQTAITILRKLAELEQDPYGFSTTALVSDPSVRRLRVGDYRVFYEIRSAELVVWVVHIAHRSVAYD